MYAEGETEVSEGYLKQVIESIEEPIVLLGGWAVRFLVDARYKEVTGRDYLGSRDIDLGFYMKERELDKTPFARAYNILVHDLGFRPLSFRLFREIHAETGEPLEMETARDLPPYLIFQIYIDMVVDRIPDDFREHFGFQPIDEPLLANVFQNEEKRIEIEKFGRMVWIPTADVLLAMKVRSCPHRDKEFKRVKDVCDVAALALFGLQPGDDRWSIELITGEDIEGFKKAFRREDLEQASEIIGIAPSTVEESLARIGLM